MLQRFGGLSPSAKRAFCAPCVSPGPKGLPPVPTTCRVGFGIFSVQPGCRSSGSIRNYLVYLPPAHRVKKTRGGNSGGILGRCFLGGGRQLPLILSVVHF